MPLDLKYRPQKFSEILGNKSVVQLLHRLSKDGKLGERSLMFGGPRGCGKTTLARIVACAIVCDSPKDGEPCGECSSCHSVRQETADNFEEFDAATQGSVERMRDLVADLDYGNLNGKPSTYVLDEAQRLTKQAQDALLKSVEERRLLVILSTTEPHKIQGPLRSRLTEFTVSAPSTAELEVHLRNVCDAEGIQISDDAIRLIIQAQDNCPRTCLTALEMLSSSSGISVDDVKSYFRFGETEKLIRAMEGLVTDPRSAIGIISNLLNSEGPSWVKDTAILVITSAVRASVGAKPSLAVPGTLYTTRGPAWLSVAKSLGVLDKPTAADIEAILLEAVPNLPAAVIVEPILPPAPSTPAPIIHPPPAPIVPTTDPKSIPTKPASSPEIPKEPIKERRLVQPKSLEIQGVKFAPDEKLTSVDDKLERGSRGPSATVSSVETPGVRLGKDLQPMATKEFSRGFIERIKGTN